jgi:pterin-4a-carbinolamine dehydratase
MSDDTEGTRRAMLAAGQPATDLAAGQGQTWTTQQLTADFEVTGFAAPFVVVRRRSDASVGSLEFQHHPRVYISWKAD